MDLAGLGREDGSLARAFVSGRVPWLGRGIAVRKERGSGLGRVRCRPR
jgi:hypothetical protein